MSTDPIGDQPHQCRTHPAHRPGRTRRITIAYDEGEFAARSLALLVTRSHIGGTTRWFRLVTVDARPNLATFIPNGGCRPDRYRYALPRTG